KGAAGIAGASAALSATGIYGLLDALAQRPAVAAAADDALPPEQHRILELRTTREQGKTILIPPLHHQVVTATLLLPRDRAALQGAQRRLEQTLAALEQQYRPTPGGLAITVAWGGPYFERYVSGPAATTLPLDTRAAADAGRPVPALLDAIRFPSDPASVVLEQNDLAVRLAADALDSIAAGADAIFTQNPDLFRVTSVRKGFVGGGYDGGRGLPKQMALAARIPGAEAIPETAQLFLGFTSTQDAALGPALIANFESLGYTDQTPDSYFAHGTTMHLSHIYEDLQRWYADDLRQRTGQALGHSGTMLSANRLRESVTDPYGNSYRPGTAILQRADFDTLDNPFLFSADPQTDGQAGGYAAGLHFVAFAPTSDTFHRVRLGMDGQHGQRAVPGPFAVLGAEKGLNAVLRTTHRQNFLVPPRAHRSFPLAELL
ncbi:MAG TPA: hypothetical protein VH916_12525, partial [Dehalococcoidia bacterium]